MSLKKPLLQKLALETGSSFIFHQFISPFFESPWHYHEEFEIVLCDGGYGQKIIGNHSSSYKKGDLMLLGRNLPHWYKADNIFYENPSEDLDTPTSIVIQFKLDSFGIGFFDTLEMYRIKQMLNSAEKGIEYSGPIRDKVTDLLREHHKSDPLTKFYIFLDILRMLSESEDTKYISDIGMLGMSAKDSDRMGQIMEAVHHHFNEDINLDILASSVGFTKAAFCRYFKARTMKTFINFLNEVRINHVCELLRKTDKPVAEIAFESGFTNISNFNRHFKEMMHCSPKEFRNKLERL
jgi:AraC-like DNA-binding protein